MDTKLKNAVPFTKTKNIFMFMYKSNKKVQQNLRKHMYRTWMVKMHNSDERNQRSKQMETQTHTVTTD
jgi:hypothetical protein